MQIENIVFEELSCFVDDGYFAAGAQSGVNAENRNRSSRRGEQHVVEIVAKHANGFVIGAAFQLEANLRLNRRIQEPLPGIVDREFELRRPIAAFAQNMPPHERDGAFRFHFDEEVEYVFRFAAADGEHAVRRDGLRRLPVLVVHLELLLVVHRVCDLATDHHALVEYKLSQGLAQIGLFADPLGHDMARAFQRFLGSGHAEFGIHKGCGKYR